VSEKVPQKAADAVAAAKANNAQAEVAGQCYDHALLWVLWQKSLNES